MTEALLGYIALMLTCAVLLMLRRQPTQLPAQLPAPAAQKEQHPHVKAHYDRLNEKAHESDL